MGPPIPVVDERMRQFRGYPLSQGAFREFSSAAERDEFSPGLPLRDVETGTVAEVITLPLSPGFIPLSGQDAPDHASFIPTPLVHPTARAEFLAWVDPRD